jgi:ABC-type lipoprotein export system ATPase subunit
MPLILHGVGHGFDGRPSLFTGLDHRFDRGRVHAVIGPSGSGKSTLLGVAAGMIVPSEGRVDRIGIARTAWVFQNPHGSARRSVLDHVSLPFIGRGESRRRADAEARGLLAAFGLDGRVAATFAELSGGEAQRLMLARAVATETDLLLVDEPTAQLDRRAARIVNTAIGVLAKRGAVVLVATHDADTIRACNAVLDLGSRRACD